jgi:hypothetical protein
MNIECYLLTNGTFETAVFPEKLFSDLAKSLRTKGKEVVHFKDRSIEVEGIFVPAKGMKSKIAMIPLGEE